jgi:hypothetical protein
MRNNFKTSLQLALFFLIAGLAYAACSSQPSGQVISGGNPTTGSPTGQGPGAGGADSTGEW